MEQLSNNLTPEGTQQDIPTVDEWSDAARGEQPADVANSEAAMDALGPSTDEQAAPEGSGARTEPTETPLGEVEQGES